MFNTYLKRVIARDLKTLRAQVHAYPDENQLWEVPAGVSNSGGTIALHLIGNIRHFIGAQIGGTSYVRDRPAEFSNKNIPREEIDFRIDDAIEEISAALDQVTEDEMSATYPLAFGDVSLDTGQFLVHLTAHFAYHLGQLDYHRRLVTGMNEVVGAGQIAALVGSDER